MTCRSGVTLGASDWARPSALGCSSRPSAPLFLAIDAYLVEVEADVSSAWQGSFNVVGLPDIAVKESRERIKSALRNCGFDFPSQHGGDH